MLNIKNLHVKLEEEDKQILKGVNLSLEPGKVHAIMGPNGSGKSTLSYVLSGKGGYEVTEGSAQLEGVDILDMEAEERAAAGLFLAFQYPVEIPGVGNMTFLRTAVHAGDTAFGNRTSVSWRLVSTWSWEPIWSVRWWAKACSWFRLPKRQRCCHE